MPRGYELADFDRIPGVVCPCGIAHRAFGDIEDVPLTVHRTHITADARLHYHERQIEIYYILECERGARMQLDDDVVDLHAGMSILIRPGTRHRALGEMIVLIVVYPKFDPGDEHLA